MKNRIVVCDSCKREFKVKKPKTKKHKDGLEGLLTISYFECKHCKKKYVTFVENDKIKRMIKASKQFYKELGTIEDQTKYDEAYKEYQTILSRINSLRKDLIFRFSKYV